MPLRVPESLAIPPPKQDATLVKVSQLCDDFAKTLLQCVCAVS